MSLKISPATWSFGIRGALESVVRANFPDDVRVWPILSQFNFEGYLVGLDHFAIILRDKLSGIPAGPGELERFPHTPHPALPVSLANIDQWLTFLYDRFSLRMEDVAVILPLRASGRDDASADFALFSDSEKAVWRHELGFAIARQQSLFAKRREQSLPAPTSVTYNIHGSNSRVNIQSTDNSVNVVHDTSAEVFDKMSEAIRASKADEEAVASLTRAIEELKRSSGSKGFGAAYREFMSVFADHIQIFGPLVGPYLPALATLAMR